MKLVKVVRSEREGKKWKAVFEEPQRTTHFGHSSYSDYTQHRDEQRKKQYLARHQKNENWNDPTTAGALSRWILGINRHFPLPYRTSKDGSIFNPLFYYIKKIYPYVFLCILMYCKCNVLYGE